MAPVYARPRWVRIVSNAIAVIMLALTVVMVAVGDWFLAVVGAVIAVLLLLGNSPLFKVAINREPDAIACRYVPWYEPGPYLSAGAGTVLGLWCVAAAFRPGFGGMFGVFGAAILVLIPIIVMKFLRGYRRCSLRIAPGALSVPDPGRDYVMTEIPRERIQSIAPAGEAAGFGSSTYRVTDITYGAVDSGSAARTVRVGQAPAEDTVWLTLDPSNLRPALHAWKDGDPDDPGLMDRVEAILRGQAAKSL